jgi:transcription initiation factor TFIID subunit 7
MDSDSDLIIVDEESTVDRLLHPLTNEVPSNHFYSPDVTPGPAAPQPTASGSAKPPRPRSSMEQSDRADRATRSSISKSKPQPKLKFKLSEKAAAQAPGMSFLGPYDRELDSDDEDLAFEEQFILRMPPGEDCDRLRKMVAAREISNDVWFKFKGMTPQVSSLGFSLRQSSRFPACHLSHR